MAKLTGTWIGAGILGGLVFAAILVLFASLSGALLAGGAAFVAGALIFAPRSNKPQTVEFIGVSKAEVDAALTDGRAKVRRIVEMGQGIDAKSVKQKVVAVAFVASRILEDIKQDPKDLRRARQFLTYYLDSTITIVKRYTTLSAGGAASSEIARSLERTEKMLDTLHKAFEKQLALLQEDDLLDLDTELQLLERTIKLEGLGEDEG